MGTTALAVELLVIGYQALIWLVLLTCLMFNISGETVLQELKEWKEVVVVGSVVVAYTVGAVVNGIVAKIMEKREVWVHQRVQRQQNLQEPRPVPSIMRAAILVKNPDVYKPVIQNLDIPKVLRSTIFNILLIGVFATIHASSQSTALITAPAVAFCFIIATGLSVWAWFEMAENYYIHLCATYDEVLRNMK